MPLAALLRQRCWPERAELGGRFVDYGRSHGAWDDARGYTEGSLARIVEAATAIPPALPSVKADPGFLCGMEFDSLSAEVAFFASRGLQLADVESEVHVQPGELLIFDNHMFAHGRRGSRRAGELRQRVYGQKRASPTAQRALRERLLAAFERPASAAVACCEQATTRSSPQDRPGGCASILS